MIQGWLRSGNTLAFWELWENEDNPDYCEDDYRELLEKKKAASFTSTPKLWLSLAKAIDISSKQVKSGDTFAHRDKKKENGIGRTSDGKMEKARKSWVHYDKNSTEIRCV